MPETDPAPGPKQEESKLLAALCYLPFMFINWICILYILIAKKDWNFGRFHAAQAVVLNVAYFVVGTILGAILYAGVFLVMMMLGVATFAGTAASGSPMGTFGAIGAAYGTMLLVMIPLFFVWMLYLAYCLYLIYKVLTGKNPQVPKLSKITKDLLLS